MSSTLQPQIIDYEGSQYRTEFWEGQGREYENLVERLAIQRLLPPTGDILLEAGAGFGRLADLYAGYRRVILMDYSFSLLQEARMLWGDDERFVFVAASIYEMPFASSLVDALVMVRVMHHLQAPDLALGEIARVLQGGKVFLLEYANKRNLKAIARYMLRRQRWNPFRREPYEFVPLNFDFHPAWMTERLRRSGLVPERELAISSFRLAALKRRVSPERLARLDNALAGLGAKVKLSPSILVKCRNQKREMSVAPLSTKGFFRCPACAAVELEHRAEVVVCRQCHRAWPIVDGVYDFRNVSRETPSA
ncbi:MAG: class I SAM-dependent methyltransferase [Chloroflexi bacterium]|nr:class I SAM-dependent methyltransferase [Chloroflexota bacterium]